MKQPAAIIFTGALISVIAVVGWSASLLSARAGGPPAPPPAPPAPPARTEMPTYPRPGPAPQKNAQEPVPDMLAPVQVDEKPDAGGRDGSVVAPQPVQEPTPAPSLSVEAEVMGVDRTKEIFFWHGDVRASYGDMRLQCLRLEGTFDPDSRDPTRLLAIGQVVIDGQRWYATSSQLEYDTKTGVAVLKRFDDRKALVHDKQRGIIIEGDEITYNSQEGTFSGINVRTTIPTEEMN